MPSIQTGREFTDDAAEVPGNKVRFVADDGRTMFEVVWNADGASIEVRGVECCRVNGVLRSERFTVRPASSNCVTIETLPYGE